LIPIFILMDPYSYLSNAHTAVIDDLYAQYQANPESVDLGWKQFFQGFDLAVHYNNTGSAKPATAASAGISEKEIVVFNLINSYRSRAHLESKTNPVRERRNRHARLALEDFGLSAADLDTTFQSGKELGLGTTTLRVILDSLEKVYKRSIGFEFMYIREPSMRQWLIEKIEHRSLNTELSLDEKKRILKKLNEAVVFENFLHTKYIGQKRFSLEGGETTIPALDTVINTGADLGIEEFVIGMAHRGRLNVLCNILGKTYENIFNEFEGTAIPDLTMGDGDVKYHMGYSSELTTTGGKTVHLKLCPNPSHLEAVNPVVEGFARAKIDKIYHGDSTKICPILIHGDAAVAGQGIVYEVTQMASLKGYQTGGTIHFVINNQVGFTTDFDDARSSIYCTDVAKIIDAPVIHVNGDDPEAVVFAVKLALEFRQKFHQDFFIDMVCYRRHGHNESDEPKFTQPTLYNLIAKHPNPREVYNRQLIERGDVYAHLSEIMDTEFRNLLQDRLNMVKQAPLPYSYQKMEEEWRSLRRSTHADFESSPETGISQETIDKVGKALIGAPENFKPIKQVEKLLKDREEMFFGSKVLNWASAELLAYGSILEEGKIVRVSGQDVERGTFSHRHAVIHDSITSEPYVNLDFISPNQEKLRIYNSLLSEYGVLGFDFGYAMANPNALTIWEAQFGDFANGTQTMIDQFITAGESKWQRMNGIVLQLPHGYEGQGPEHSNARPERFLQLAAEDNIVVANVTQPSNFFHLLRRQLAWQFRKPCIVMSPKSLLRNPLAVSPIEEFKKGSFQEVIGDTYATGKTAKKVLIVSGKLYYELYEKQQAESRKDVAIIRMEQLHPYPTKQLEKVLKAYKNAPIAFVQEEPENMGYWNYIMRMTRGQAIDVISRKPSASPATGFGKVHAREQAEIIGKAFTL